MIPGISSSLRIALRIYSYIIALNSVYYGIQSLRNTFSTAKLFSVNRRVEKEILFDIEYFDKQLNHPTPILLHNSLQGKSKFFHSRCTHVSRSVENFTNLDIHDARRKEYINEREIGRITQYTEGEDIQDPGKINTARIIFRKPGERVTRRPIAGN